MRRNTESGTPDRPAKNFGINSGTKHQPNTMRGARLIAMPGEFMERETGIELIGSMLPIP